MDFGLTLDFSPGPDSGKGRILCQKSLGCQQHPVFPGGHPSKYWLGSMLLNFSDRTRTGVFSVIWPLATLIAKLEGLTLKIKFKTVRWGLTEGWLKVRWALRTQIKIWKISNGTKGLKIFTFSARPPQQNIIYFCGPSAARPAPKTCRRLKPTAALRAKKVELFNLT